jgi:hypothetical protein
MSDQNLPLEEIGDLLLHCLEWPGLGCLDVRKAEE